VGFIEGYFMKKIGFLSFGHWSPTSHSQTRSAADVLLQSIDLAVAAEELGADGAYFRVHHFARQLSSPFRSSRPSALRQNVSRLVPA
jgi:alkanesulfonate monooxygenase SsuD/methylene tetrahydromethanopterin reductase-like flavin-dependent oxidoreductase (luciferase family)